ncbi:AAA family ATPase [Oryzomonas rubra]|uniref:RNA helicase n=1 Tax=Oryzomonas rubra TaxID=2509454 RepID=A0A5A9XB70_9BACT|nr:AAA family ATPase [Oryzomonas rubra]KAA0889843.1 RNA helicase [Oryzomonas rubra]
MDYPLRHISIRVPWHDTGWDGRVCSHPGLNGACLKLKRIGQKRDEKAEEAVHDESIKDIPEEQWPCCVPERMAFMAPFEYTRTARHPYNNGPDSSHGHFKDTPLRHPPFTAAAVPFAWMLRDEMQAYGDEYGLDVQPEREPDLGFETQWVQDYANQKALLDCFSAHLKPQKSLCFFYAKQVPFVDDAGGNRIIIGVGRVQHVAPCQEYLYLTKNLDGKLRSALWELMVQHTIRPDFQDGFLLPYHAAIAKAEVDPDFDPASIAAFAPDDRMLEFSHASQLVTHDGAIASLLACAESLRKAKESLTGPWDECLDWIDLRLSELWKLRGPCPGLSSALSAFGLELGAFVARAVADKVGDNEDPWPFVDQIFQAPEKHLPPYLAQSIGTTLRKKWSRLPDERRALLKLVSRFELTRDQATTIYVGEERQAADIDSTDSEILVNPYLLYELTRLGADPISIWTIDRGVFPEDVIRKKHPLPSPSALDAGTDARRVCGLSVKILEDAARNGSTLLQQDQIVLGIRSLPLTPPCLVDGDLLEVAKDDFPGIISETKMANGAPALQLTRLDEVSSTIRTAINKRIKGNRLAASADWRVLLDDHLTSQGVPAKPGDELEEAARQEKTAALKELSESRLSVLVGPAGTGKTTLLSVLCKQPEIAQGEVLLLAPTGKARVRMEQSTRDLGLTGFTIAQFLAPDRYDRSTARYRLSDKPVEAGARTVIVDEASMLTEEMLAALIQGLKGVHRLILIGDPRQLPPIGAGRPFVDLVNHLAPSNISSIFPRVSQGYAELTVRLRQAGEDREDLQLAEWFSGSSIAPGEDGIFSKVMTDGNTKHVRFVQWDSAENLTKILMDTLVKELKLDNADDVAGFNKKLGGQEWNDMWFFNCGVAEKAENWQILSPVRAAACGVQNLNRLVHKQFRQEMIDASRRRGYKRKHPKPMGPEEIVYGDKVINLDNTDPSLPWNRHRKVYPNKSNPYIANGEIGMAVGFFWKKGLPDLRYKLEVEFSSQPGFKWDFLGKDFDEEGSAALELAYALTVHKSQGSEFGTVILVLPNPCRLLSREMLYTALTRQTDRIVILHQGARSEILKFSSDECSETARRLTNLFVPPSPIEVNGRFYEDRLIHRTSRGEMVRSKSEVIIADHLASAKIEYGYEQPLAFGGAPKYPDFTIEDEASGVTYYWEHCGMLHVPTYRRRWKEKLIWYKENGVLPYEDGGGRNGALIITQDESNGSIDSAKIKALIKDVLLE